MAAWKEKPNTATPAPTPANCASQPRATKRVPPAATLLAWSMAKATQLASGLKPAAAIQKVPAKESKRMCQRS
ncbi:hypothetical protein D9M68_803590 [compost metagenome]